VNEYTPLQIKVALTGYGRADKNQVEDMVKRLLGRQEAIKTRPCFRRGGGGNDT